MKAHKLTLRVLPLTNDARGFPLDDLVESIILNTPPGGSTTEQIIKSGVLYSRFMEDKKKNDGAEAWDWWIEKDLHATLLAQIEGMRWATTTGEIRLLVISFLKEIRESKEIEASITPAPAAASE